MTHAEMVKVVRGKRNANRRKIGNNTYAQIEFDGRVTIYLHSTPVVCIYPDNSCRVTSGGWRTSTTKDRINKYSPIKVYQKKHVWYFENGQKFEDNTIIAGNFHAGSGA